MADLDGIEVQHYFVGGGAWQSAEQVRRLVYGHQQGAEGICEVGDLLVRPLAVPGGGVRVAIGSAFIVSRYAPAVREMYFGSVVNEQVVTIPENTSSSKRSDLIVMRVKDPYPEGSPWDDPGEGIEGDAARAKARADAQYIWVERIPSVPSGTTRLQDVPGYEYDTGLVLARIDMDASWGSVDNIKGKIVDLRYVHTPRQLEMLFARPRVGADDGTQIYLNASNDVGGEFFPGGGGISNQFQLNIPVWATRMVIDARWMALWYAASKDPRGYYWMEFGDEYRAGTWPGNQQFEYATQKFAFNSPATSNDVRTDSWILMDEVPVPAKFRGKSVTFVFKAGLTNTPGADSVVMSATGGLGCRVTFAEIAAGADLI